MNEGFAMSNMKKLTMPAMLQDSFESFADRNSLCFVGEEPKTYRQLKADVEALGIYLRGIGIQKGSKVAILSTNMPNWGIAFFALGSVGAIAVPVLPDFRPSEIRNIIKHAEVEAMFVSENLLNKVEPEEYPMVRVIHIETFRERNAEDYPQPVPEPITKFEYEDVAEDDLMSIIYTSGTTGKSKGVMLSHKNLVWTARQSRTLQYIVKEDRFLSVLPLSHTFENTLTLILPIMFGASVHYLRKPPTAPVLLPALKIVKPTIMLVVPLIIEKIYKGKILPQINSKKITREL